MPSRHGALPVAGCARRRGWELSRSRRRRRPADKGRDASRVRVARSHGQVVGRGPGRRGGWKIEEGWSTGTRRVSTAGRAIDPGSARTGGRREMAQLPSPSVMTGGTVESGTAGFPEQSPGAGSRPRRWCLVVGWEHRPAQDQWLEGECLRGCLRPRTEVVCRTAGSGRGGWDAEEHEERQDRPEPQRHRGSLGRGLHYDTGVGQTKRNGWGTRDPTTAADIGLLDRLTRLIERIAAIKDLQCGKSRSARRRGRPATDDGVS